MLVRSDAETSERGYLLTGDSTYLTPFTNAQTMIPLMTDTLQQLASGDSLQTRLLEDNIIPLTRSKLNQFEAAIQVRRMHGLDSAVNLILTAQNRTAMDSLRGLLHQFDRYEKKKLSNELRAYERSRQNRNFIRYTSFVIIAAVSVLALFTIRQKQRKNLDLVKALRKSNNQLEQKVADRTRELMIKNELEEQLNDELRQTLEELQSFYDALQIRNTKAEDTLRAIRDLYDFAPCGYHSLAPDGTILRMNAMELLWLGYMHEEVVGKMKFPEILTAAGRIVFEDAFAEFKETGIVNNIEFDFVRKDGTTFPVLLNATALYDIDGNFIMSRATSVDISDRKYMEEELREANEKLTLVNEEKNRFLGMAAHDLKSPLNGVLGLITLLKKETPLDARQTEYLGYIEDAGLKMKKLITNLLDINRIELGLTAINPEPVPLLEFVNGHIRMLTENARKKNITLRIDEQAGPVTLYTDANALGQILDNLLSNAIKFSTANTTVTLRTALKGTRIIFSVTDEGPGISPDDMPLLFGKFRKLSARPTGGESSTGLGLSIVKELVTSLQGKITVTSEAGKGATFTVDLPVTFSDKPESKNSV